MVMQHSNRAWGRPLLLVTILMTVIQFDGGGSIVHGGNLQSGAQAVTITERRAMMYLDDVVPDADSFSEKQGEPPVFEAYQKDPASGEDKLIGYAFFSPDFLPEPSGYSGPVKVLIGMDLEGLITGVKVIYYRESLRYMTGDFLEAPGVQEQFIGMRADNRFRVYKEIDGISRATVSTKALARTVRNSVRQVAKAYLQ